jgi:hypothetical protein
MQFISRPTSDDLWGTGNRTKTRGLPCAAFDLDIG